MLHGNLCSFKNTAMVTHGLHEYSYGNAGLSWILLHG
jgi:hypothetical protein